MRISREEYYSWKSSTGTRAIQETIQENIEMAAQEVLNRQRPDPDRDMYLRGFMQGLSALFNWSPEFQDDQKEEVDE